jgi:hypothetical protein
MRLGFDRGCCGSLLRFAKPHARIRGPGVRRARIVMQAPAPQARCLRDVTRLVTVIPFPFTVPARHCTLMAEESGACGAPAASAQLSLDKDHLLPVAYPSVERPYDASIF